MFDLTSPESYESLEAWRQTFFNTTGDMNIPLIIIGNKADKGIYVEKSRVLKDWVDTGKARAYIEASAMKYIGIEETFSKIGNHAF